MTVTSKHGIRVGLSADFLDENRRPVFPDIGLALLDDSPRIGYDFLDVYLPEYTPDQLRDYDVLISLVPRVSAASLEGVDRLCAIGRCGVGYDNVDLAACTAHDIAVYITPQAVIRPVASSIVLFVLALSHDLMQKDRQIRRGQWKESRRRLGSEPRGRTIGTIGLGNIGSEALRLLRPFGIARFLAFDPYVSGTNKEPGVEFTALEEVLREADYLMINCPLTKETRGMIGERELSLMKPTAYLINTARGPIVNQNALIGALAQNRIRGAALDVFEKEPIEADSPLLQMENVILTSHSVAWTEELFRDMGRMDCEGALAVSRGEAPANVVNQDVLDRPGFREKLQRCRALSARSGA